MGNSEQPDRSTEPDRPDRSEPRAPAFQPSPSGDIDIIPPTGVLARGARERRLERVDRYDRRAEVTAFERLTDTGTILISFRVVDDRPFRFDPGHFVGIRAEMEGHGLRRSPYCISSAPNDDRTFRLLVRVVPEGPLSRYLDGLQQGDVIDFRGPSGRSMLPKEEEGKVKDTATELILLATGVGIGPLLSLVRYLAAEGADRPIRLYWGLRLVDDICMLDELDALVKEHESFSYQISLSQPPPDWPGLRGRLTESVPGLFETLGDKHFYLVGNGAMIEEMSTALSDLGVDQQRIHEEVYFNVRYRADPEVMNEIRDRFVACDLFSPYLHQKAGLFMPESPLSGRSRRS